MVIGFKARRFEGEFIDSVKFGKIHNVLSLLLGGQNLSVLASIDVGYHTHRFGWISLERSIADRSMMRLMALVHIECGRIHMLCHIVRISIAFLDWCQITVFTVSRLMITASTGRVLR